MQRKEIADVTQVVFCYLCRTADAKADAVEILFFCRAADPSDVVDALPLGDWSAAPVVAIMASLTCNLVH